MEEKGGKERVKQEADVDDVPQLIYGHLGVMVHATSSHGAASCSCTPHSSLCSLTLIVP